MTSLNSLHTTLQGIYNQLSSQVQSNKPGQTEADVAQRFGIPAGLVQDLRNDLKAVVDGHDPEKAAANLLKGLEKLQAFVGPQGSRDNAEAKERPADLGPARDGMSFVMGKDGQPEQVKMAEERPADLGPARDGISFVMGKDGQPEQVNEQVKMAKERPADLGPARDGMSFVMGKDGQPEQVNEQVKMAKERPADLGPARDGMSFVMGKDGRPEQISSTEVQHLESQASGSVEAKSDKVVSYLKQFLEADATGNNAERALEGLREAMQNLFHDVANNPDQVLKALMNSIRSQA